MDWLADQDTYEIAKYQGKYIAIWKHKIIAIGKTGSEARRKARQKEPNSNPTVFGVPPEEGFIGGSNFVTPASR